jgi:RNA polymerase sigma-70 factor (ECF subfamily)
MNASIQRTRDAWLALRCQSGEPEAFRELVDEFERPLLYFAAKLLGSQDAALDVMQQTWLRALRRIRSWCVRSSCGLGCIRSFVDWWSITCGSRHRPTAWSREYAEQNTEMCDEPTFDPEDAEALHLALTKSTSGCGGTVLHFLEDLPIADVAAIVGCPEGTVKSRLHHGKRALGALLRGGNHAK